MNNDYIRQFTNACADNDVEFINKFLLSIDDVFFSIDDLLTMISLCLNKHFASNAILLFKKALTIKPQLNEKLTEFLNSPALSEQLVIKQALIDEAVKVQTTIPDLLVLGLLYRDSELFECAEQLFLHLIEKNPRDIRIFHRLISVYIRMQRYHDAIACCQLALEIDSRSVTANYNLGIAYLSLNQDSDAFSALTKTVKIDPENHWAHINIAQIILKQGYFDKGWQQYEWRKKFYKKKHNDLTTVYPEWSGQNLTGKTLLVWADQGLGDIIMYAGLLTRLAALGAKLSIMAESRLKHLFERSFPIQHFYPELITLEEQNKHNIDYQIPFSGLGARFIHSFADFCATGNYLMADQCRSQQIRESLIQQHEKRLLVGFSWRGGVIDTRKFARNIPLQQWQPLLVRSDCLFINLQYDSTSTECSVVERYGAVNLELDLRNDIEGVAAALQAIDILISLDNSTAHIAGALGKPVWNLLPFSGEWRWFLEKEKSYWYQSMRLFRQQEVNDWDTSLVAIDYALSELLSNTSIETSIIK